MAVYKIFPEQDTFIYTQVVTGNAGYDEILEIGGYNIQNIGQSSRALIQFKTSEIRNTVNRTIATGSWSASLDLSLASGYENPDLLTAKLRQTANEDNEDKEIIKAIRTSKKPKQIPAANPAMEYSTTREKMSLQDTEGGNIIIHNNDSIVIPRTEKNTHKTTTPIPHRSRQSIQPGETVLVLAHPQSRNTTDDRQL